MTNQERARRIVEEYKRRRDHEVGEQQAIDELKDAIERALDQRDANGGTTT